MDELKWGDKVFVSDSPEEVFKEAIFLGFTNSCGIRKHMAVCKGNNKIEEFRYCGLDIDNKNSDDYIKLKNDWVDNVILPFLVGKDAYINGNKVTIENTNKDYCDVKLNNASYHIPCIFMRFTK